MIMNKWKLLIKSIDSLLGGKERRVFGRVCKKIIDLLKAEIFAIVIRFRHLINYKKLKC